MDDLAAGMAKQLAEIVRRYQQHKEELRQQRTGNVDMSAGLLPAADLARLGHQASLGLGVG